MELQATEFAANYQHYLDMIESIADKSHKPLIDKMRKQDPHDLVGPQHYFTSESAAIGFLFVKLYNLSK